MKPHAIRLLPLVLLTMASPAFAQPAPANPVQRELIYCAGQMSHEEREAYRAKMQATRSADEKAALRASHQAEMQQRARAAGLAGQCEPRAQPARGQGGGQAK
ncbi:MAG: hypothetical protein M0Q22_00090 [Sulfuritalea sp.]|jgi:hypothetical protein|nr:hypothetical protein [Sulfuritalea sp.]